MKPSIPPPDNDQPLPPIPVALEHLLGLAAASPEFADALRRDRNAALEAAGLELSASERAVLGAVPPSALDQMITQVEGRLEEPERRRFLEHAALAVAALVAGTTLVGCSDGCTALRKRSRDDDYLERDSLGCRPRILMRKPPSPSQDGASPPPAPGRPGESSRMDADGMEMAAPPPDAGVARPRPRPMRPKPTRGIRPRDPRLRRPRTYGISPNED